MKKLAGEFAGGKIPQTPTKAGLLTPHASPKSTTKRSSDDSGEEGTPRKLPKRAAKATPKYKLEEFDGEEGEQAATAEHVVDNDDSEEWEPEMAAHHLIHEAFVGRYM